jgi:chorismate synthase
MNAPTRRSAGRTGTDALETRVLHTPSEYRACTQLQRLTWGAAYQEVIPVTLLGMANRLGGLVAGAFRGADLLGFVLGFTGVSDGRRVHWSHMLAVRPDVRDLGIGRRLKMLQYEIMRARGVEAILWSYDPLVARNAHLNLNRLGVAVIDFVEDMYPGTGSGLHEFGTDRFVVEWPIAAVDGAPPKAGPTGPDRLEDKCAATSAKADAAVDADPGMVIVSGLDERPARAGHGGRVPAVRVEVPPDIEAIAAADGRAALAWRQSTRRAFRTLFERGYAVTAFTRAPATGRCFYLLTLPAVRTPAP